MQPGSPSLPWPWVSRGTAEKGVDKVQAWDIAVPSRAAANSDMARAVAALNYGYSGLPSTAFGNPGRYRTCLGPCRPAASGHAAV